MKYTIKTRNLVSYFRKTNKTVDDIEATVKEILRKFRKDDEAVPNILPLTVLL
jgi:hypothetical protein